MYQVYIHLNYYILPIILEPLKSIIKTSLTVWTSLFYLQTGVLGMHVAKHTSKTGVNQSCVSLLKNKNVTFTNILNCNIIIQKKDNKHLTLIISQCNQDHFSYCLPCYADLDINR